MNELSILIVEDDQDLLEAICTTVKLSGYKALGASSGTAALDLLNSQQIGLVISDVQMQPIDGNILLKKIKETYPDIPVLLMTAYGEINKAIAAMRAGASDYLLKPFSPDYLLTYIKNYLVPANNQRNNYEEVIAKDPRTSAIFSLAKRVAESSATVMLIGESGSGKEVLARYIHQHSPRLGKPFVAINCAAIPENLLESELFGHEKGAFTGAIKQTLGKIELAQGGTFFLDEVGDLPLSLQAKLLRFLQERVIERVGGREEIPVDVRVICATHQNLKKLIEEGRFREDLFYRLGEISIKIPPLRERLGDAVLLAHHFRNKFATKEGRHSMSFTQEALSAIETYNWPGNIREMENCIKRAVIMTEGPQISLDDLGFQESAMPPEPLNLREIREKEECKAVVRALAKVDGNIAKAAELLGVSRPTLYDLMNRHGLK